jgi:hypothetical protein
MDNETIELVARALMLAKGLSPDALYQHHEWEDWPVDQRHEYVCAITNKSMVQLSHKAWRMRSEEAKAVLTALTAAGWQRAPDGHAVVAVEKLEAENELLRHELQYGADHT